MAKHHEEHPDYAEMGIFAGYGEEEDRRICPFLDPEFEIPVDEPCPVCGATGKWEDFWDEEATKRCHEAGGEVIHD